MEKTLDTWFAAVNVSIEAMSIYQRIGGTIFLVMTIVFFSWILYLMVTK